jgi:hypothetical protein
LLLGVGGVYLVLLAWRQLWAERARALPALIVAGAWLCVFGALYLLYNVLQTGDALLTPRAAFSAADRYGFGLGVGFYGEHTLAAGLVILDQLLTTLLIDLYGWPFYLSLAFLPLGFLRRSSRRRWDILLLALLLAVTLAQVGYFYHGIYLGPRYLFAALPALLLLSARGMLALPQLLRRLATVSLPHFDATAALFAGRIVTVSLVVVLFGCSFFYFIPRQVALYRNYTGLPYWLPMDSAAVYAFHPQNAIILTGTGMIYSYMLFPLNDPDLRAPTLYAYDASPATIAALRKHYPDRTLYMLEVLPDGRVQFAQM